VSVNRTLPVWLLDIDGVINCTKPDWHQRPYSGVASAWGREWHMRWSPSLIREIFAIKAEGLAEVRWCTTWCGNTQQFAKLWNLALSDSFPEPIPNSDVLDTKIRVACDVVRSEKRALIWTDDHAPSHGLGLVELMSTDQPVLIIRPSERFGLTVDHIAQIRTFCEELRTT
jgi:hypothetical protein